jgi:hypothetical protein
VSLAFEGSSESVDSACESHSQSSPGNRFVADAMDLVLFDHFVSQRHQELVLAGGGWHSVQQLQQLRKGSSNWAAAAAVAVECQAPAIGSHVRIQPRRLCCD